MRGVPRWFIVRSSYAKLGIVSTLIAPWNKTYYRIHLLALGKMFVVGIVTFTLVGIHRLPSLSAPESRRLEMHPTLPYCPRICINFFVPWMVNGDNNPRGSENPITGCNSSRCIVENENLFVQKQTKASFLAHNKVLISVHRLVFARWRAACLKCGVLSVAGVVPRRYRSVEQCAMRQRARTRPRQKNYCCWYPALRVFGRAGCHRPHSNINAQLVTQESSIFSAPADFTHQQQCHIEQGSIFH